jgi:NADH-quinone oxidoreductase subunit I/NAD(P)H-quinone oxidoreductase subunit I
MREYFKNIKDSAVSIFEGMAVTLSWMLRKPITIQYPDRAGGPVIDMIPERSRGILEVDVSSCIGDLACMRACPIGVIKIEMGKTADGTRAITRFDIDASRCMYCGLCTEVCNTGTLVHTKEFEVCARNCRNLVLKFVDQPVPPYKIQKDVEAPRAPKGAILKKVLKRWDER